MFYVAILFSVLTFCWKYRKVAFKFLKIYSFSEENLKKEKNSSSSNSISMSKI
jgi:hypothetical protein